MGDNAERTAIQKKTFTRWVNVHLWDRKLKIEDLQKDLSDGVNLIHLMEIISGKSVEKWNKKPKMNIQKLENLNKALDFIKNEGIKLVNIGSNDIHAENLKIILGLIWTLILRYQINKGGGADVGAKRELMEWVNRQIAPYHLRITNFTNDFADPRILSALTDSLQKGCLPLKNVSGPDASFDERMADIGKAIETADNKFAIPQLMDAKDLAGEPDELGVMTYVSFFRDKANEFARKQGVDAKGSYAKGPGLETGPHNDVLPRTFRVYAIDNKGNLAAAKDAECAVTITDPYGKDVPCQIEPSLDGDGTYVASYKPTAPGKYKVEVAVNGDLVKDMPKTVLITNGACGSKMNNCKFTFTIHARNEDGELETEGGDLWEVDLQDDQGEARDVRTRDNNDGTYSAEYHLDQGALYTVHARLNGSAIANSPFTHDLRARQDE